jgi:hypothetical protein
MTTSGPRRGSMAFAFVLIAMGVLFLLSNLRADFDPWPFLAHWWPVLLIVLGIAKLMDHYMAAPGTRGGGGVVSVGLVIFVAFIVLVGLGSRRGRADSSVSHTAQSVEKDRASSVVARIEMGAGQLDLGGGSPRLLDADFNFSANEGEPRVDYRSSGNTGDLSITQREGRGVRIGHDENRWNLKLANDIPMEINLKMGAGEGNLRLRDVQISRLEIQIGAGELNVDLTGDRKRDLTGSIHGGAGEATIRLPHEVGVQIHASGGLGTISSDGFHQNGSEYTNDAWGKSPVSIRLDIEGGVGTINLIQQ